MISIFVINSYYISYSFRAQSRFQKKNYTSLTQSDINQFKILESNNKVYLQNQINTNLALSISYN